MSTRTAFAAIGAGLTAATVGLVIVAAPAIAGSAVTPVTAAQAATATATATAATNATATTTGAADLAQRIARQEDRAVKRICHRLALVDKRAGKWLATVNGGADTKGSVAALKARAAAASAAGDAEAAARLTPRAERRAANAAKVAQLAEAAAKVDAEHC